MSKAREQQAIVLISCEDQRGIISVVTDFIIKNNGNILDLDEHVDPANRLFFMRVAWGLTGFKIPSSEIQAVFQTEIADPRL